MHANGLCYIAATQFYTSGSVPYVAHDTSPQWRAVAEHAETLRHAHIRALFAGDLQRAGRLTFRFGPLLLDLSRQRIEPRTLALLAALAEHAGLPEWRTRLLAGDTVNSTEQQPALHSALRLPADASLRLDGEDLVPAIERERARMEALVGKLHAGQWRGYSGKPVTDIVNIGVGGSDLGPAMVCEALFDAAPPAARGLRLHFASSMDGSQLNRLLQVLDPEATLFVVSSKSFTTADTLANARTAREWLLRHADEDIVLRQHFVAVTANVERAQGWGIPARNILRFWSWVGGRYSLWSTIGFPIALRLGMDGFRELLAGAHALDEHFRTAPLTYNLPVLLGLVGVWNSTFLGLRAHAILPYDGRLALFPAYLEQLAMESNGKQVDRDGVRVNYTTCPVLWGGVGPNAQHAFYQLLHQGTVPVACDFIAPVRRRSSVSGVSAARELAAQHRLSLANCLAQARLLAMGDVSPERPAWRHYHGNQPSTTLLIDELTPYSLGMLVALYEQRVFVESVIWNINPFDQWGVELGKQVAHDTLASLADGAETDDAATALLVQAIRDWTAEGGA